MFLWLRNYKKMYKVFETKTFEKEKKKYFKNKNKDIDNLLNKLEENPLLENHYIKIFLEKKDIFYIQKEFILLLVKNLKLFYLLRFQTKKHNKKLLI